MSNFERLKVWQLAMDLALDTFALAESLPPGIRNTLGHELRRTAISVPSNLAEGADRGSDKENARFTRISLSSLSELQTQLTMVERMGLRPSNRPPLIPELRRLRRMIHCYLKRLSR